ncbi:D-alanyl-D-alanine carboxypeptidase [Paenibacillus selenitireducens]|uniref:serine-type D-Ala-D-Ala carboxypeptidase n=1 Tax=Paenibacillus selenitireducens TaxID=1324314 RepID=A0A1T2X0N9_9BACL|nr:D-alanyl-D-alanine carboxypeptidase [Paenibacillus selenitireducens]
MKENNYTKTRQHKKRQIMKKTIAIFIGFQLLCGTLAPMMMFAEGKAATTAATTTPTTTAADISSKMPTAASLNLEVSSAILMEASTGKLLVDINADVALPPASMTKMMAEYIVTEQVKQGKLKWDTVVTTSENASKAIGSRIFLAQGDQHTVEELFIAMAVGSANDATIALAEHVAGSEQEFVKMMNDTAKKMGMKSAYFINSTGLSRADMPEKYRPAEDRETVMSARDVAILAQHIVKDHPDFGKFTTIQSYKFRERDKAPIINYNWMLESNKNIQSFKKYAYEGLDGLKTGHTIAAGMCFAGTAERNGMRLISVVMGAKTEAKRFIETKKVLDYGFNNFEVKQAVASKSVVQGAETAKLKKGKSKKVAAVTESAVSFVVPKGANVDNVTFTTKLDDTLIAPIKKGQKVGEITYTYKNDQNEQKETVNLVAAEDVEKAGWLRLFFRAIGDFFADLFSGIKNLF